MGSECEFTTNIKQKAFDVKHMEKDRSSNGWLCGQHYVYDAYQVVQVSDVLAEFDKAIEPFKAMLDIRAEQRASLQKELTEQQKQLQDIVKLLSEPSKFMTDYGRGRLDLALELLQIPKSCKPCPVITECPCDHEFEHCNWKETFKESKQWREGSGELVKP